MTALDVAQAVAELVRIPSVNPMQSGPVAASAGPVGERALAEHLADRFDGLGAREVVLDPVVDDRPNVIATIAGRTDRLVVLDAHLDTVTVEHMTDPPFDGRIADGHVWGRGALDTKASLGVIIALLERWGNEGLRPEPTVMVVGTVGEEAGGLLGATRFRAWTERHGLDIDELIVAEPTRLAPIHGHKGGVSMYVTVHGRAAHSALPHLGENAIEAIVPVIAAVRAEHARLQTAPPVTELGTATVSVCMIEGGTGGNVIPASCRILVGRRVVPGEDAQQEFDRLTRLVTDACPLPVTVESVLPPAPDGRLGSNAFYQSAGTALVRRLAEWAGTTPAVAPFGTNALRYGGLARELAVFGPGSIDDAHGATECVAIADLERLAAVYAQWLGPS